MNPRASSDTSNLLVPGSVLLLLPRLVPLIGLNGAIVLQQVRFLTAPPRGVPDREGRRWVRLSYAEWQEDHFPFWKIDTVKRAFQGLEEEGLLDAARTYATPRDQTKSYAINYGRLADLERAYRAATEGTTHVRAGRRRSAKAGAAAADQSLPASNLLLDDNPLVIIPRLAVLLGLDEALVLQQVRYWLADDRHPHYHEGRRWVRFTQQEWARQIPRSLRTLGTVFREMESQGLLIATTRLNTIPGDQTKWYTIDFERLQALEGSAAPAPPSVPEDGAPPALRNPGARPVFTSMAPIGNCAPNQSAKVCTGAGERPNGPNPPSEVVYTPPPTGKVASNQQANLPSPVGNVATSQSADSPYCIEGKETGTKTNESETQQQDSGEQSSVDGPITPHVVIADQSLNSVGDEMATRLRAGKAADTSALVKTLVARGVTGAVAIRLAARFPKRVTHQTEVYDWLCEEYPDDERLTPGRLRRMIEDDWTTPPGFIPAAERVRLAAEAAAAAAERVRWQERACAEERRRREAAEAEYTALLASLGLRAEDQTVWRTLADSPPRLPSVYARALFYAPQDDTPPVIIFRERTDLELVVGAAYAKERAEIEQRLCDRFPAYRRACLAGRTAMYLAHDDILAALNASSAEAGTGAGSQGTGLPSTGNEPAQRGGGVPA